MTIKAHQEVHNILPIMGENQVLRRVASDVTNEISDSIIVETILQAQCDCCGLKEDCTKDYISRIRNLYSGKWVCGLCSEAVNEMRMNHGPLAMEEAMSTHTNFVQEFNSTTRLNPKLSLTWTMRDIAKKNGDKRKINLSSGIKIMRSFSCVPRIN